MLNKQIRLHYEARDGMLEAVIDRQKHLRQLHPLFEESSYTVFTMLSANLLVQVNINRFAGEHPPAISWKDLLHASLTKRIVMRGEDGFFCNAVLLPFYRMCGIESVRKPGLSAHQLIIIRNGAQIDITSWINS